MGSAHNFTMMPWLEHRFEAYGSIFHSEAIPLEIKPGDVKWMQKAFSIAHVMGVFPSLFLEELQDAVQKYNAQHPDLFSYPQFVRASNVSLKTGMHGIGPYGSLKQVFESIVTSRIGHTPITFEEEEDGSPRPLILYFMRWKNLQHEFRVFVYQNHITAMSQQHLYSETDLTTEQEREQVSRKIILYLRDNVLPHFTYLSKIYRRHCYG